MDILTVLDQHRNQLGVIAATLTIAQYFGGLSTCYYVQMDENYRIPNYVFIGNLIVASMTTIYACLIFDILLVLVNVIYAAIDLGWIFIHWYHSTNRWTDTYSPLLQALTIIAAFQTYRMIEKEDKVVFRFGIILNLFTMLTLVHPSKELEQVIKDRTSPRIGMPVVLMTTLIYSLWLLYGIAIRNVWIFAQNLQWFVMCLVQLLLCSVYPQIPPRGVGTVPMLSETS